MPCIDGEVALPGDTEVERGCCRNKDKCYTREIDLHGLHIHEATDKVHELVEFSLKDPFSGKHGSCRHFDSQVL